MNLGLIDTPQKGLDAGHRFRSADVDLIFLYVTTYALSSTALPVVQRAKVPVVILNLQPTSSINYEKLNKITDRTKQTGHWLSYVNSCPVPELSNVFHRAGVRFHEITGMLNDDPVVWREVDAWIDAARVAFTLSHSRLGMMGHLYCGMLDISCDTTQLSISFGTHITQIEVDELTRIRESLTADDEKQIASRVAEFRRLLNVLPECSDDDLTDSARTSLALDRLVERQSLGALAFYYSGSSGSNATTIASIILGNTLLTARGIPVGGEYDARTVLAMKILDTFGAGGSFAEFSMIDFASDVVLMGHDGACHIGIAESSKSSSSSSSSQCGAATVRPISVFHGKSGSGLSIDMQVRHGPVTLMSICSGLNGSLKFVIAEGESVAGDVLEIGNTNTRFRFAALGARRFVNEWNRSAPGHHCAIGVGHLADKLDKLAKLLNNIELIRIC